jgi:hypothetical protein
MNPINRDGKTICKGVSVEESNPAECGLAIGFRAVLGNSLL